MLARRSQIAAAALGLALSLAACGTPLEPSAAPEGSDLPSPVLQNAMTLALVVADASSRIVPSLDRGIERDMLAGALASLYTALENGAVVQVRLALVPTQTALANYAATVVGDGPAEAEVDAIKLAVDAVAADAGTH